MRILTNNYQDCKFLNLGSNKNGRGPYVLRQDGVSPGSLREQEDRFFQDAAELYIGGRKLVWKACCRRRITCWEKPRGTSRSYRNCDF